MRVASTYKLFFTSKEELERKNKERETVELTENENIVLEHLRKAFENNNLCTNIRMEFEYPYEYDAKERFENGLESLKDELIIQKRDGFRKDLYYDVKYTDYFICYNKKG